MNKFKKNLFSYYKIYRTSKLINDDLKILKKINNLSLKYLKLGKTRYKLEIINIIRIMYNLFNVDSNLIKLLKEEIIEEAYHNLFTSFLEECKHYSRIQNGKDN